MNKTFKEQSKQFGLVANCESCRYFCKERELCGILYPVKPHREKTFKEAKDGERIYFCKMFEAK
jgi:hypothetical protein